MSWLSVYEGAIELDVLVVTRSSRNRIAGEHEGRLKVQVNAPPVEGQANAALVALLAKRLGVKRGAVAIVAGATGRRKRVRVDGVSEADARELLGG